MQSYGVMECVNGHKFFCKEVGYNKCKDKGIDLMIDYYIGLMLMNIMKYVNIVMRLKNYLKK